MSDDNSQTPIKDEYPHFPPSNNALLQNEEVFKKFVDAIQSKVASKILTSPSKNEKKMLTDAIFYPGVYVGSLVGLASFIALRKAPLFILNQINARNYAASLGKTHAKALQPSPPKLYKEGPAVRLIGTIFDSALAFVFGGISWALAIDKKKVFAAAADIPLVEGKSEISDKLCSDFIHIYHETIPSKFWTENSDDSLTTITNFVKNCEKRHLYERRLRREMGLSNTTEVSLPSRVPEMVEEDEMYIGTDWAALEDFDEVFVNNDEGAL